MSSVLHTENTNPLRSSPSSNATRVPRSLHAVTALLLGVAVLAAALPWLWYQRLIAFDHNLFIPPSHQVEYLPWIISIAVIGCATAIVLVRFLHRHSQRAYLVTVGLTGGMALGFITNQVIFTPDPLSMIIVMSSLALLIPLTSHGLTSHFLGSDHRVTEPTNHTTRWQSASFLGLTIALAVCVGIMLWAQRWPIFPALMESSVVTGAAHTARPINLNLAILCVVLFGLMVFTAVMLRQNHLWANALAFGMAIYCLGLFALLSTRSIHIAPLVIGFVCAVATIALTVQGRHNLAASEELVE